MDSAPRFPLDSGCLVGCELHLFSLVTPLVPDVGDEMDSEYNGGTFVLTDSDHEFELLTGVSLDSGST